MTTYRIEVPVETGLFLLIFIIVMALIVMCVISYWFHAKTMHDWQRTKHQMRYLTHSHNEDYQTWRNKQEWISRQSRRK